MQADECKSANKWRRANIAQDYATQSPRKVRQNVVRRKPVVNVVLNRAAFE